MGSESEMINKANQYKLMQATKFVNIVIAAADITPND